MLKIRETHGSVPAQPFLPALLLDRFQERSSFVECFVMQVLDS